MTPKRKTTPFTVVNLIHCRRVRRRDLLANSERSPTSFHLIYCLVVLEEIKYIMIFRFEH
ncbi:MAG: hypothetical protein LBK82_17355 [Planctomycetaceae bacterium]|nr:hypothetical protein [Planctomycetaceae bacterium]